MITTTHGLLSYVPSSEWVLNLVTTPTTVVVANAAVNGAMAKTAHTAAWCWHGYAGSVIATRLRRSPRSIRGRAVWATPGQARSRGLYSDVREARPALTRSPAVTADR